jgi:hypothetical protein
MIKRNRLATRRRLESRWRAEARRALFDFAYLERGRHNYQRAREFLARIAKYPTKGIVPFHSSEGRFNLKPSEVWKVQRRLQSAVGRLVLSWSPGAGMMATFWQIGSLSIKQRFYRTKKDSIVTLAEVKPDWLRLVSIATAILGEALPQLRECTLCQRLFFRIKRQVCCCPPHAWVLQARTRGALSRKGGPQGRKRKDYGQKVRKQHEAWRKIR